MSHRGGVSIGEQSVGGERARILYALLDHVEGIAGEAVAAIRSEIPAYAAQDDHFFVDVRDQVRSHYRTKMHAILEDRPATAQEIAFVRGAATRRARAGFALEDYINAFRVGQQVFWEAMLACAEGTPLGHEAALTLATPIMRYVDFASTQAGHAYVEFQQYVVADADRERRDLLEHLLAGELPTRGALLAAAQRYGIGPDTRLMVATAMPVGPSPPDDASNVASAAIARTALREAQTLVVVRQGEIVALPVLPRDADPTAVCAQLEGVQARLCDQGIALAMGIATVASGVADLPRAYRESCAALEGAGALDDGGVIALPRLSPFGYLTLHADDTAGRLVDDRLRTFLTDDRARGGVLTATIRMFTECDLNLRLAADRMQVHPNTAQYRLRRIEERTGRNPRRIADLVDLLVAIALDDRVGLAR